MATTVYDILEVELQDGTAVEVRPLPISKMRKATKILASFTKNTSDGTYDELEEAEVGDLFVDTLVSVVALALETKHKALSLDKELLLDNLDMPTMYKIVEVAAGWNFGEQDPKVQEILDGTT